MLSKVKELILLCSVLAIQNVTGSSNWCSRVCCYPNHGCCGSHGSNGYNNYGGWNGYKYLNFNPCWRWKSNGGWKCCDSCGRTGSSDLPNGSGYGGWTSSSAVSGSTGSGMIHKNAGLTNGDYGATQSDRAGYSRSMWNKPNRFADYARWSTQGYGTTSYDKLNVYGQRTQGYGTTLGQGNNNYGAGYNTWNSPNRYSGNSGYDGHGYGARSYYDGLNSPTSSFGYDGSNSFVSGVGSGGSRGLESRNGAELSGLGIGADSDGQSRLISRGSSGAWSIPSSDGYADWNSPGPSNYHDWNSLARGSGHGITSTTTGWNDMLRGARYAGTGYDGYNDLTESDIYEGLVDSDSNTGSIWYTITSEPVSSFQNTRRTVDGWNCLRIGAGYNPWNNLGSRITQDGLTSSGRIGDSGSMYFRLNGISRGNSLAGLDDQGARRIHHGWNSDDSDMTNDEDYGNGIYEVWENLSNYEY
uniref:Uncharacterized protein n=1 Tax=Lygus hesperus TaxID=30085 RepID=A0A146KU18_LYGHE